jgi:P-type Na+/K+ transporter
MVEDLKMHPFLLSVQDVAKSLETDLERGLTSAKVTQLQQRYPPNELDVGGAIPWHTIFLRQLFNAMILVSLHQFILSTLAHWSDQVLFFAMGLSFGVNDYVEGGVLAAVIILNVSIGFYQEYGAEKKMEALRALSSPSANVLRDGKTQVIPK